MKKFLFTIVLICIVASACTAQPDTAPISLIGSWKLSAYGPVGAPTPVVPGSQPGLTFTDDGTVNGNSGCNGLSGSYEVEGNQITFGQIISTLMACDSPVMEQEEAVFEVITGTASFKVEGNMLTLTNNGRVLVLTR